MNPTAYMGHVGRRSKEPKTELGKWVRAIRDQHRLGVEEFADALGVDRVTVNSWEGGKHGMNATNIGRITARFKGAPPFPGSPESPTSQESSPGDLSVPPGRVENAVLRNGGLVHHTLEGEEVATDLDEIQDKHLRRRARYAAQEAIARLLENPSKPNAEKSGPASRRL